MRPGIYKDKHGDTIKVTRTRTGYRLENQRTGAVSMIGGAR